MSVPLGRIAPTSAVLALACYCVYPYAVDAPPPAATEPKPAPSVSAERLSPELGPAATNDPFRIPGGATAARKGAKAAGTAAPAVATAAAGAKAAAGPVDPFRGLHLEATLIRGGARHALIGGKVYSEGESIRPTGPAPPGPVIVANISAHAARLECGDRSVTLDFISPRPPKDALAAASRPKPPATKPAPRPAPGRGQGPRRSR